jgi:dipeptidyl aminopeptidase/acylaminoacyl peptidase
MKMRVLILLNTLFCFALSGYSQKSHLEHTDCNSWPHIYDEKISPDGKYIVYTIDSNKAGATLIIKEIENTWQRAIKGGKNASITNDNGFVCFSVGTDSLGILNINNKEIIYIKNVKSFKVSNSKEVQWLIYLIKDNENSLVFRNMKTSEEKRYTSVNDFYISESEGVIVLSKELKDGNKKAQSLTWIDFSNGKELPVWKDSLKVTGLAFDKVATKIAFITEDNRNGIKKYALMYFKPGMDSAVLRVGNNSKGINEIYEIANRGGYPYFSNDGNSLFFAVVNAVKKNVKDPKKADINVWNYKDYKLQSQQLKDLNKRFYLTVINENSDKIIMIESADDELLPQAGAADGMYFLVANRKANYLESNWNTNAKACIYLVSAKDGSRKLIKDSIGLNVPYFKLCSDGKYVVYYDNIQRKYLTYNIQTGAVYKIGADINEPVYNKDDDRDLGDYPIGLAGWLNDKNAVLLYDNYDIWEVDLAGMKPSVNITNGLGQKNKIFLRYVPESNAAFGVIPTFSSDDKLLLTGFNRVNKYNGFFWKELNKKGIPEMLTMGPYVFYIPLLPSASFLSIITFPPVKAKNSDVYILERRSSTEAPNLFVTRDFKAFRQVTDIQPQKNYNWMTTELVRWKMYDGKTGEGILYKPENFDPKKKYPVIFHFYERSADGLNNFLYPEWSNGTINIPWFVSNEYLVFSPNIYYKKGRPGESAYNSVVSAARYLACQHWVDSTRMALQGHSFGAFQINYLVTKTKLFSAASSSAGVSDMISGYGQLRGQGNSRQYQYETGQSRMGTTLWENRDNYYRNSPVLAADKVSTPLLIMHNEDDDAVPFSQGVEWFTALRRLGKKVWMLEYDGEGHGVFQEKNQLDFSIRLAQFFDHYLKNKPAPKWMTKGILAIQKGIEDGLEPDSSGQCAPDCRICKKLNAIATGNK